MRLWVIASLALAVLALVPGGAAAQSAADLFEPDAVHDIRLFINSRDLRRLREDFTENTYYTADLAWRGLRVRNVGIRSRGMGSRNPTKLGLLIDFDRYTTSQTFLGLESLVLDNLWQDPSLIQERTAMSFFRRMGAAASRESFCRLYINNQFQGLYAVVEAVDRPFLTRAFGEDRGYLFRYDFQREWRGDYLGDDLDVYRTFFEAQTRQLEADSTLYGPIRDLFREVNADPDAVWRDRVAQYIDLPQLVTHAAIDVFLANEDSLAGAYGMNNFFLYRREDATVHRIIPWDIDTAFVDAHYPIFGRTDDNALVRRALAFDDLRELYLTVLEQCARSARDDDWLVREVERLAALAAEPAAEDTLKQFTTELFEDTVDQLRGFATGRPEFVLQEVARARGEAQ
jgi:spore coat protein CotH